jgi:hypothetical protein
MKYLGLKLVSLLACILWWYVSPLAASRRGAR